MSERTAYWYPAGRGRRHQVSVDVDVDNKLQISAHASSPAGASDRSLDQTVSVDEVKISDRLAHVPRFLRLPDGSTLEFASNKFVDHHIVETPNPFRKFLVHRLESRWIFAVMALVMVVAGITGFFRYVLPPIAAQVTRIVPVDVEDEIGFEVMEQLDANYLTKSTIWYARKNEIRRMFEAMVDNIDTEYDYKLYFRSGVGANAFALPGGHIVLTQEFVELVDNDEEIRAVLAHEIGHVEHQHTLNGLIKDAASVVLLLSVFGDVSAVSALALSAPTFMAGMQFSRSHETEADRYAVKYLISNDEDPMALATMLTKLIGEDADDSLSNYFSTHPGLEKRIENIKSFSDQF